MPWQKRLSWKDGRTTWVVCIPCGELHASVGGHNRRRPWHAIRGINLQDINFFPRRISFRSSNCQVHHAVFSSQRTPRGRHLPRHSSGQLVACQWCSHPAAFHTTLVVRSKSRQSPGSCCSSILDRNSSCPVLCQRTEVFNVGCRFIVGSVVVNPTVHTLADNPKRLYAYQFSFLLICIRWSWVCDALCNWVWLGTWLRFLQLTVWFMVYFCGHIECPRLVLAGQLRGRLWLPPRSPVGPQHARRISFPRPSAPPRQERLSFR